jgi:hypothetical protein
MEGQGYNRVSFSSGIFVTRDTRCVRFRFAAPAPAEMMTTENMDTMRRKVSAQLPDSDPVVIREGGHMSVALTMTRSDTAEHHLDCLMDAMVVVSEAHSSVFSFRHGDSISLVGVEPVLEQTSDSP